MRHLRHTVIGFSGMIQVLVWVECVHIDLGWIYDCIIDYSLVRDSKNKKKLDYDYTGKFGTSIETLLLTTSLRRVSSHVCLPSPLSILI